MNPLLPFLEQQHHVILDGALSTELERRGADLHGELWSARVLLENPSLIRQVHFDYFHAGADVAITASYQATLPGLMRQGLNHQQAVDALRLSVSLALEAREEFWQKEACLSQRLRPLVAASIGCYGASLHDGSEYRGDYGLTVTQLMDWHRERLEILAVSGADLLAFETIPCQTEAEALVRLLADFPQITAWLSVSCCDEQRLCHGESITEVIALANEATNIVAAGVNCTGTSYIDGFLQAARATARKPLLVYPNSGETWDARQRRWIPDFPKTDWRDCARRWYQEGARLIGGCCRTTPETIREIVQALRYGGMRPSESDNL